MHKRLSFQSIVMAVAGALAGYVIATGGIQLGGPATAAPASAGSAVTNSAAPRQAACRVLRPRLRPNGCICTMVLPLSVRLLLRTAMTLGDRLRCRRADQPRGGRIQAGGPGLRVLH